jgi:L-rhamnose-H+ transport protein
VGKETMVDRFSLGLGIIFLSGLFNGAFPLPMKSTRDWKWENTWLAFSVAAVLVLPWLLAVSFVPNLGQVYRMASPGSIAYPATFGFLWGIAQVTFGLGIDAVGMAVAIAVVAGLGSLSGALVPLLVLHPEDLFRSRGILLLIALPVLLVGLFLYGKAGSLRARDSLTSNSKATVTRRNFASGLAICVFTGIFTSTFNLGFAFSGDLSRLSITLGASDVTATYVVWAVVFTAGFFPNLIYCSYLLFRNHSWHLFLVKSALKNFVLSFAMAALWGLGVFGYGIGATVAGSYGTSIGFALFFASTIICSNVLGIWSGEWKATTLRTRQLLTAGLIVILLSIVLLSLPISS